MTEDVEVLSVHVAQVLFDDQVRKVWIIAEVSQMLKVLMYMYLQRAFLCVKVKEVEFTTLWQPTVKSLELGNRAE